MTLLSCKVIFVVTKYLFYGEVDKFVGRDNYRGSLVSSLDLGAVYGKPPWLTKYLS